MRRAMEECPHALSLQEDNPMIATRKGRGVVAALIVLAVAGSLNGCGTWMHGDHQSVTIVTTPPESTVVIDERVELQAPGTVSLNRRGNHHAVASKDGYEPTAITVSRTWSWWVVGDVFGCLILFSPLCIMHDIDEGGYYTFDDTVYLMLDQRSVASLPGK
jgi:hypothetical protein